MSLVIFDLDGVLVDTNQLHTNALRSAIVKVCSTSRTTHKLIYEKKIHKLDWLDASDGTRTWDKLLRLQKQFDMSDEVISAIDSEKKSITLEQLKNIEPNPKISQILRNLTADDHILALASNSRREFVNQILESLNIKQLFTSILCGDEVKNPKPNSEIYDRVISDLKYNLKDTYIFEDSEKGLIAAKASGARVIQVDPTKLVTAEDVAVIYKPRIAVLISGEYRTFDICRPTMTFLDDPSVDVYFSTWDVSEIINDGLQFYKKDNIDLDTIRSKLPINSTILIEPIDCITETKYNTKMLHRWLSGIQLIKQSGIKYSHILVSRPDLFFNGNKKMFDIESLLTGNRLQFGWYNPPALLQDNIFFGTSEIVLKIFDTIKIEDWERAEEQCWHTWWTAQIKQITNNEPISRLGNQVEFIFCRSIVPQNPTYIQVVESYRVWRDIQIVSQVNSGHKDLMDQAWGTEEVSKAMTRDFSQHIVKKKVAVLVCGMIRQLNITLPSWENLRKLDADWFLSSWDKSSQGFSTEMFTPKLDIEFLTLFNQIQISKYDVNDPKYNSYMTRCGGNSLRYLHLISTFKEQLASYDRIVIIRPDTFVHISNLQLFVRDCIFSEDVISNIAGDQFLQDIMFVVPGKFFEQMHIAQGWADRDRAFNPHIKWPHFIEELGIVYRASNTFDVAIARPNSQGKHSHTVRSINVDCLEWGKWHTNNDWT